MTDLTPRPPSLNGKGVPLVEVEFIFTACACVVEGVSVKRPQGIVRGQRVEKVKLKLAKQLRRKMTPQEALLWARVRRNGLNGLHFRRQQIVDGFLIDFYCHQAALVLELDGPIHLQQAEYDAERSRWLQARGLRVLRIPNADIESNLEAVLIRIAAVSMSNWQTTDAKRML